MNTNVWGASIVRHRDRSCFHSCIWPVCILSSMYMASNAMSTIIYARECMDVCSLAHPLSSWSGKGGARCQQSFTSIRLVRLHCSERPSAPAPSLCSPRAHRLTNQQALSNLQGCKTGAAYLVAAEGKIKQNCAHRTGHYFCISSQERCGYCG